MSDSDRPTADTSSLTAVALALEARRELALESVKILIEGLRVGDHNAIHLGLRGLGVSENTEMYEQIGMMTNSLHMLLADFRSDLAEARETPSEANIVNAADSLEEVMQLSFNAADRTMALTKQVSELLRQQEYAVQIASEVLNDEHLSPSERQRRLNEFLSKQLTSVTAVRILNQEVLSTQSFEELTTKALSKVIRVVQDLEGKLETLDSVCHTSGYAETPEQ